MQGNFKSQWLTPTEINIGDLLRLALPLKSALVTTPAHRRREVQWIVLLMSWNGLEEQVKHGDLVLVSPLLQTSTTGMQMDEAIGTLAQASIACLVLMEPVAEEIIATAKEHDLPLLVLPAGTPMRETHRNIVSVLVDRQVATSERGMQVYRRLSEMSREGKGLANMTEVMSKLTGKIIVVQDKRLEIQARSVPPDSRVEWSELAPVLGRQDQLPAVLRNRKAAAKARQSHWQQLLPIKNIGRIISPIISGDRARGYLSVVGAADELDLLDCLTAEHGAAACSLEMAKAKAVSEAKKSLRGDFLEGLLAGSLAEHEIERLAGRLDHDTHAPHAALTFGWDGLEVPSLRRLETTINWLLSDHPRSALVHIHSDQHVCVFQALRGEDDMGSALRLADRLRDQTSAEYPEARLIGGISGPAETLADWPAVYREALQSMQLGQRLQLSQVVEYGSLGVYRLLGQLEHLPAVRSFVERVIGPLVDYDTQHQSSLVQTLDAYFKHHGNISQTAESLFIHRNTLLYRLERIKELTSQDLNQANMRLALQLALGFWQLRSRR